MPGEWVRDALLTGNPDDVCIWMGRPVTRAGLSALIDSRQHDLAAAGLRPGGTVALRLPPSLEYIATLLAAWRAGGQVSLLDHRLVPAEVDRALDRLAPQILVTARRIAAAPMAGYAHAEADVVVRPDGRPAATPHALIQLSSGSTGPSKVIARTADSLLAELARYAIIDGYPGRGARIVLLASTVHVLGLVGGLLHCLHSGARLVFPDRVTADGIRTAVAAGPEPATVLGVPFHAELLTTGGAPIPQLTRMVVAGELVRPWVPDAFRSRYGVPLGTMYGMTEAGVIATDISGRYAPSVEAAPGMELSVADGELLVRLEACPYLGPADQTRWADGWLRTRDAATIDPATRLVTIRGRLDSQVSIGGLKVDLTEVEQTLCMLPQVESAVVTFAGEIEAFLVLRGDAAAGEIEEALAGLLAAYKRPTRLHVLPAMPRTATGKVSRDQAVLRAAVAAGRSPVPR